MPITFDEYQGGEARDASSIPSSRADVLWETFAQAYESNPLKAISRYHELSVDEKTGPRLDAVSARQKLTDAGFENELKVGDAGITQAALDTLMERKRVERRRNDIFSRAQGGLVEGTEKFGLSIATSLADPVGAGLNFVPIVGQTRYYSWMARASFARRAAIRAGVGAIEGTVGGAIAEVPVYAMRTSEQADFDMGDALLDVSFGGITGAGLHTTVGTLGEGIEFWRARGSPIEKLPGLSYGERVIEMRAGQHVLNIGRAEADYSRIKDHEGKDATEGGRVLNTDIARELSPDYRRDRTLAAAVHEPSSHLIKQLYARRLADAPKADEAAEVLFTAGGAGAGKSTSLDIVQKGQTKKAQIIYDTNLDKVAGSVQKIEQALAAGKKVRIAYTYRDPIEALTKGALPRAMKMGRTVPLETHAKTHVGAADTIKALADKYKDNPNVRIDIIDNSRGRGNAALSSVEAIPTLEYNRVREDLRTALEAERAAGRISDAVYRGTAGAAGVSGPVARAGAADGRGAQPRRPRGNDVQVLDETAAERAALATPAVREAALRAAVGQGVSGNPINVDPIFANDAKAALAAATSTRDAVPNREYTAADKHAEETLALEQPDRLKAAQEVTQLAIADAKALQKRLGIEEEDAELTAAAEGVKTAERWAQAAEIASTCLLRGG